MEEQLEQKAKQCAAVYEARIMELESNHATEKAQLLAKAVQDNRRHGEETAHLNAEIESLQAKLKSMQEAGASRASVKKEPVGVVDEEAIRQEMELRFTKERQQMEQRFVQEKQKIEQENASMKELLASNSATITSMKDK
ncbi:hypothetical protein AAVH_15696 [Aphelenchoides avenae]|nr:hypothetical protein AAVH_15696 [Aphelenchus avenae]